MRITLRPERILVMLLVAMAVVLLGHVISAVLRWTVPLGDGFALSLGFDVDQEISVPTWFSQVCLLFASAVALAVGLTHRSKQMGQHRAWFGIAGILAVMSLDEGSSLHELIAAPLGRFLETEGTWLYFAWVLVGLGLVALVVLVYVRFWWRLPRRTRWLIATAALLYVGGSIGLEILGGYRITIVGVDVVYMFLAGFEETLEMLGAIVAVYAFLDYLRSIEKRSIINIK